MQVKKLRQIALGVILNAVAISANAQFLIGGMILNAVAISANAQYKCDQMLQKEGFEICYNYKLKAPLYTRHIMKYSDLKKQTYSREGLRFFEDVNIPRRYRATLRDYRGSGFDRGHMVSNRSQAFDRKRQKATFVLSNITPQYPNFNRGIFRLTEKLSRKLVTREIGSAVVYTGAIFDRMNPKRIGPGRIAVPSHVYKVINFKNGKNLSFLIPNIEKNQGKKPSKFRVDVREIEKLTGMRFH